jgi:hypothetical protein
VTIHPAAREFLLRAIDSGWSASLVHGSDTGANPFVTVTAQRAAAPYRVRVTWHTRETGTYRLSSAMVGQHRGLRDVSLTKARDALAEPVPAAEVFA